MLITRLCTSMSSSPVSLSSTGLLGVWRFCPIAKGPRPKLSRSQSPPRESGQRCRPPKSSSNGQQQQSCALGWLALRALLLPDDAGQMERLPRSRPRHLPHRVRERVLRLRGGPRLRKVTLLLKGLMSKLKPSVCRSTWQRLAMATTCRTHGDLQFAIATTCDAVSMDLAFASRAPESWKNQQYL